MPTLTSTWTGSGNPIYANMHNATWTENSGTWTTTSAPGWEIRKAGTSYRLFYNESEMANNGIHTTPAGTYVIPSWGTLTVESSGGGSGSEEDPEPPSSLQIWSIDNGTTWHDSGETIALSAGTYTIHFDEREGYVTPSDAQVVISTSDVTSSFTYSKAGGGSGSGTVFYRVSGTSDVNGDYYLHSGTHGTKSAIYTNGTYYIVNRSDYDNWGIVDLPTREFVVGPDFWALYINNSTGNDTPSVGTYSRSGGGGASSSATVALVSG